MSRYSGYERLLIQQDGKILRITLNLPEKRNIVGGPMSLELIRAVQTASSDDSVAVIVLTGAGGSFSAGGDIVGMQTKIDDPSLFYKGVIHSRQLVFSMLDCPKPVVCRVNGHAIGLGATIALLCDVVIANEDAKIGDPHVRMGLVAGDGGALIWPQLIGYARARKYLLGGDLITGKLAAEIGLIAEAGPMDVVDRLTEEWAQKFAEGATQSIAGTKITINLPLRQAAQAALDVGMAYEGLSNITKDHQEAVSAFIEKRKPSFTGE
ncbi:enoyl-CoA hydratase/isomerase family protein [Variovorax sp. PBL-E5]|uniref:enoyl-CoA hydratase/isomerase family protein n=1 Tax=Variovorax sp. PBL-E5 TaxID=434014 RepID=UPI0013168B34|nr:enoyl-CoA hydratase/isomerase family protein [Variovorax sp. PBL-E5]VTU46090.1 2,3-dehydroadipyl-CoA hydratase [Variovorax sp. PBL-E5]